jgi:predicted ArsR family transcriptional regulator
VLNRLMRRPVLAKADRIVSHDVDNGQSHEGGEPKLNGGGSDALRRVARSFGSQIAQEIKQRAGRRSGIKALTRAAEEVLQDYGFEPFRDEEGNIRLRNCPFHSLSRQFTGLVCGMNLEILQAMVEGLSLERLEAQLEPQPGMCCVAFRRA